MCNPVGPEPHYGLQNDTVALSLDATSVWQVTGTSYPTSLTDADATLASIHDHGHTIYYDAGVAANGWLDGKTRALAQGGKLVAK